MSRIYYGWWIVLAAFSTLFVCAGIGFFTLPVFLKYISADMNWGRDSLSNAAALSALTAGFVTPVIGYLIDRFGTRAVMMIGVLILSTSFFVLARIQTTYQIYIIFFSIGIGMAATTLLPCQTLISRWFEKRRGRAMGIIAVANGLGGVVWMNISDFLIQTRGWRNAYEILGIIIAVISLPLIWFIIRNSPKSMGLPVDGYFEFSSVSGSTESGTLAGVEEEVGYTLKEALRTISFWLIFCATFFVMFAASGFGLHIVAFLSDSGFTSRGATMVWSISLGISIAGRFTFGFISEHYPKRYMASIANLSRSVSILLFVLFALQFVPQGVAVLQLVILYGLGQGCNAVINPLLVGETFGVKAFGKLMGLLGIPFTMGAALGQASGGWLFEWQHNYHIAFGAFALSFLLAGIFVFFAKPLVKIR